jgi:surfeit locus 1 family protein
VRARAVRSLIVPGLFALAGIAVLSGLGVWQLERLAWKNALIAQVEMRLRAPAVRLSPEAAWGKIGAADEYRRVTASGAFRHDKEAPVYAAEPEEPRRLGGPGYLVLTPLTLAGGASVIVNRGFVPLDRKDPATRRQGQVAGTVSVTGLLRLPEEKRWFTPENDPKRGVWYRRDPVEIALAFGLKRVAPFIIDADAAPNPGGLPQGGGTRVNFPNNHLQYAVTWFGLALALLAVFAAFAWQRLKGRR